MRLIVALGCLVLMCSCNFLESKEVKKEKLIEEQLRAINWNDVDQYPLFEGCDESEDKKSQKACFQYILTTHMQRVLAQERIRVKEGIQDTLTLFLIIRNDGSLEIEHISKTETLIVQIPDIELRINNALRTMPQIYPAIKRGVKVATKVSIPIVLSSN